MLTGQVYPKLNSHHRCDRPGHFLLDDPAAGVKALLGEAEN